MKKVVILVIVLILILTVGVGYYYFRKNTTSQETATVAKSPYIDISPVEAKRLMLENPSMVIIDISPYYDEIRIPGAVNYQFTNGDFDKKLEELDKEGTYLVYCHYDQITIAAATRMGNAGFKNVYRLTGNIQGWAEAGYEVITNGKSTNNK